MARAKAFQLAIQRSDGIITSIRSFTTAVSTGARSRGVRRVIVGRAAGWARAPPLRAVSSARSTLATNQSSNVYEQKPPAVPMANLRRVRAAVEAALSAVLAAPPNRRAVIEQLLAAAWSDSRGTASDPAESDAHRVTSTIFEAAEVAAPTGPRTLSAFTKRGSQTTDKASGSLDCSAQEAACLLIAHAAAPRALSTNAELLRRLSSTAAQGDFAVSLDAKLLAALAWACVAQRVPSSDPLVVSVVSAARRRVCEDGSPSLEWLPMLLWSLNRLKRLSDEVVQTTARLLMSDGDHGTLHEGVDSSDDGRRRAGIGFTTLAQTFATRNTDLCERVATRCVQLAVPFAADLAPKQLVALLHVAADHAGAAEAAALTSVVVDCGTTLRKDNFTSVCGALSMLLASFRLRKEHRSVMEDFASLLSHRAHDLDTVSVSRAAWAIARVRRGVLAREKQDHVMEALSAAVGSMPEFAPAHLALLLRGFALSGCHSGLELCQSLLPQAVSCVRRGCETQQVYAFVWAAVQLGADAEEMFKVAAPVLDQSALESLNTNQLAALAWACAAHSLRARARNVAGDDKMADVEEVGLPAAYDDDAAHIAGAIALKARRRLRQSPTVFTPRSLGMLAWGISMAGVRDTECSLEIVAWVTEHVRDFDPDLLQRVRWALRMQGTAELLDKALEERLQ